MFCKNCGTELKEGAAFCGKCGNAVNKPAVSKTNKSESAVNSMMGSVTKKMNNKALIGIVAVAAIAVVLFFVLFSKPTINMNKYVEVEFDGYEGIGTVHVTIDWEQIEKDYGNKLKVGKLSKEEKSALGLFGIDQDEIAIILLKEGIDYSVDRNSGLSNGDRVSFEWDIEADKLEEYLKVKIKAVDKEYTVKNLEEIDLFNPFEYVTVSFTGTSPNGSAEVKKDSNQEMMNYINVLVSKDSNLSNGDKITVTTSISISESNFANKFGCLPSETEKEYEVSGLPGYITATSEIPEETMAKMKKQSEDTILGSTADWNPESKLSSVEYIGNYFITPKVMGSSGVYNKIYLVYKVNAVITRDVKGTTSSQEVTYYYGVAFSNMMSIPQDGSVFVDLTKYEKIQNSFRKDLEFIGTSGTVDYRYYFDGYETLDEIYNVVVIKNIENYNYEENITK